MDNSEKKLAKQLFLLGGMDLEMQIIESLLIDFGYKEITNLVETSESKCYANKRLKWGASLNDYKEYLDFDGVIYGIELLEHQNKSLLDNYIRIDHHNDYSDRPTSIEQVIEILNEITVECQQSMLRGNDWLPKDSLISTQSNKLKLEPIQFIKLVAANDRGHVVGMRELSFATEDIIMSIRYLDRIAQGITQKQWEQGAAALENAKRKVRDVTVVKSPHSHFSVITDRLNETKLIIHDENQIIYYGKDAHKLVEIFADNIAAKNAFFGGSTENGFFGFNQGTIKPDKLEETIAKIVDNVANREPISHHIFLMPFQWDFYKYDKRNENYKTIYDIPYQERSSLGAIEEIMQENISGNLCTDDKNYHKSWKRFSLKFDDPSHFNEYSYFYNHVREALFERESDDINEKTLLQYEYNMPCNLQYIINIRQNNLINSYKLLVENITLNFYDSGVGVFAFHLTNNTYYELNDILNINDFGRRIYPQFLSNSPDMLSGAKGSFLADSIVLHSDESDFNICEDFTYYDSLTNVSDKKINLPKHIQCLLGKKFTTKIIPLIEKENKVLVKPIIDDRMFVLTWYGNDNLIQNLVRYNYDEKENHAIYNYESSEEWNKMIFVDNADISVKNINMLTRLNKEHTYERWVENKALYGISRYSFVLLTDTSWFPKNILLKHLQTMYFQLVMLALVQRASVLRFSIEVTSLSGLDVNPRNGKASLSTEIGELHRKYIRFVNKVYFREVTAQEQGIELYDMLVDKLRIHNEVKDLDNEIEELYRYVSNQESNKSNKMLEKLNILVIIFMLPSLIMAFFGMNIFTDSGNLTPAKWINYWPFVGFIWALMIGTSIYLFNRNNFKKKKLAITIIVILFLVLTALMFLLPIFNCCI